MEPGATPYERIFTNFEQADHQPKKGRFKDENVRGLFGVNFNKIDNLKKFKFYIGAYLLGTGEIVKSASGDTEWFVPKKSREAFFNRYQKEHPQEELPKTLVEFIRQHEIKNVQELTNSLNNQTFMDVQKKLKDCSYSQGPITFVEDINRLTVDGLKKILELQVLFLKARSGISTKEELATKYWETAGFFAGQQQRILTFKLLEAAATLGDAIAQNDIAYYYFNGFGVEKDEKKAFEWCQKAANQGHAAAQCSLGRSYEDGIVVAKDEKQAVFWYKKAAEQDYPIAQNSLGNYYFAGNVIEQNLQLAFELFEKAANQGDPHAQYNLGYCYETGNGVNQDKEQAIAWYKKAADQGLEAAQERLRSINESF